VAAVIYTDDVTILDADILYRRVPYSANHLSYDVGRHRIRPSGAAFNNTRIDNPVPGIPRIETYMSVFINSVLVELNLDPASVLVPNNALVSLSAVWVRAKGVEKNFVQQLIRAPLAPPPDGNPAHSGIVGRKTGSLQNEFTEQ